MFKSVGIPAVGVFAGFLAVYFTQASVPPYLAPYVSLAAIAALDAILGGIRAGVEGKYNDDILLSGFIVNTLLAAGLAYLGDRIGVDLFLAVLVAIGGRILLNLSLIRRYLLTERQLARKKDAAEVR